MKLSFLFVHSHCVKILKKGQPVFEEEVDAGTHDIMLEQNENDSACDLQLIIYPPVKQNSLPNHSFKQIILFILLSPLLLVAFLLLAIILCICTVYNRKPILNRFVFTGMNTASFCLTPQSNPRQLYIQDPIHDMLLFYIEDPDSEDLPHVTQRLCLDPKKLKRAYMGWIVETIAFSIPILLIPGGFSLLFWIQNQPLAGAVLLLSAAILLLLFFFHSLRGSFQEYRKLRLLAGKGFIPAKQLEKLFSLLT